MDWLKGKILALIAVSALGLGAIGGGYYHVVAPASNLIPPRFYVQTTGGRSIGFYCDLTIDINAMCRSNPDWRVMENHQIILARHPGDATRIMVGAFGTWEKGLTWQELSKGVTVGGYTVQGIIVPDSKKGGGP